MIGIDLLEIERSAGSSSARWISTIPTRRRLLAGMARRPADGVMSDMAANATGHRKTDQLRIIGLVELAADFACDALAPGGFLLAKVLQGGSEGELLAGLKREFAVDPPPEAQGQPSRQRGNVLAGDGFSRAGRARCGGGRSQLIGEASSWPDVG